MAIDMNPKFHPNILKIYSENGNGWGPINLYRGSIINKDGTKGVRFLYNPSQIELNHPLNAQQVPSGIPGSEQTPNIATDSGSLGFSLLFDRTYEVWQNKNDAGVLVDVKAFYALTKVIDGSTAGAIPDTLNVMSPEPAYFYFGQAGDTLKTRALTRPLSYYGWITSLSVTYTHWSNNMIPMRCAVSISVNLIPNTQASTDAGGPGNAISQPAPGQSLVQSNGVSKFATEGGTRTGNFAPGAG